ncbi:MAG: hypothetical protein NTZ17_14065 [Phycisphaerae bacterium]|nr:hypothetical protein [Phycisphaerae bacterium]
MDNVGSNNPTPKPNAPILLESEAGQPIRLEPAPAVSSPNVSRAPLNLGSGAGAAAPSAPPAAPRAPVLRPAPPRPAAVAGGDRITACKTFFTKLHPGALHFLEEQITGWLKDNPGIVIKRTDVVTGEITEKKAEPSLIIVVWY